MVALAVAPALASGNAPAPTIGSDSEAAEQLITAVPALSSQFDPGDDVVVRVTVEASELIDGIVELRRDDGGIVVASPVTVTGGSSAEVVLVAPTLDMGSTDTRFAVTLVVDRQERDRQTVRFQHTADTDVVGVLPALVARNGRPPNRATLAAELRRVELVAVDPATLELGPAALSQLEAIAGTSADLQSLSPAARAALLVWLDHGGQLVLDDADALDVLPPAWRPGDRGQAIAGSGEVRIVDGLLTDGKWGAAIAPSPLSAIDSQFFFGGGGAVIDPRLTLARRAGVELPDLTVILLVLVGYVVLVGPILFVVLRRMRRLSSAWFVIPATAVVLAGGIVVTGSSWRSGGKPTSATVLEVGPAGGYAYSDALVYRRSGGTASVGLPDGWKVDDGNSSWFGSPSSDGAARRSTQGDDRDRIEAELEPGQVAVLSAEGPATAEPLTVTAEVSGTTVTGTITNQGRSDLQSVAVFVGDRAVSVGDIAAGASTPFEVERVNPTNANSVISIGDVWPDESVGVGFRPAPPGVDLGIWSSYALRRSNSLTPPGTLRVAGWAPDRPSEFGDRFANATMVTTLVPLGAGPTGVAPLAVRVEQITSPFDPRTGVTQPAAVRFVLPIDATDRPLVLDAPPSADKVKALSADGKWISLRAATAGDERTLSVPPELVVRGALTVSYEFDQSQPFDPAGTTLIVRGADDD